MRENAAPSRCEGKNRRFQQRAPAAPHAAHRCVLKKGQEPRLRGGAVRDVLQFFIRIQQKLTATPAMAAKVTDRLWEMSDLVEMIEAFDASRKRAD
jgi:hypothetical protein